MKYPANIQFFLSAEWGIFLTYSKKVRKNCPTRQGEKMFLDGGFIGRRLGLKKNNPCGVL